MRPKGGHPIIIDAGTGLRRLGKSLMEDAFGEGKGKASILISHTHWDHVQGLPFFSPAYQKGNEIAIYARQRDMHLEAVFSAQNRAPYFPVPLSAMQAQMKFHEVIEGQKFTIGTAKVSVTRLNHPWIAIAYRVDVDGASVVYCSDTAPFADFLLGTDFVKQAPSLDGPLPPETAAELAQMRAGVINLARNADLLIYDTQFSKEEYRQRPHWGHSHPDDAIAIAREAKAKTLCLFHHAPLRTDDENDQILEQFRGVVAAQHDRFALVSAYEGLEIPLGDE
ncbi:MAG: MBL fold metallo-hydrolase [Myxococcales bacterium]|nr:MBL fold metallo-hydrolase [Myxococcales bacterium]